MGLRATFWVKRRPADNDADDRKTIRPLAISVFLIARVGDELAIDGRRKLPWAALNLCTRDERDYGVCDVLACPSMMPIDVMCR
jgi:hypothetical protein